MLRGCRCSPACRSPRHADCAAVHTGAGAGAGAGAEDDVGVAWSPRQSSSGGAGDRVIGRATHRGCSRSTTRNQRGDKRSK